MQLELWSHQRGAVDAAHAAVGNGRSSGLWVMPTGSGKTVAFVTLARELGLPTLVVVHRKELLGQAVEEFKRSWPGVSVAALSGEGWEDAQVVVAMIQSLHGRRLGQIPQGRFGLVVIDEAHHATTTSWQRVIGHFSPDLLLGCTATPTRLDGKDLADVFGGPPLFTYELGQAMDDGIVVPARQHGILTTTSLEGVKSAKSGKGDFIDQSLAPAVKTTERNREVVEGYIRHGEGRAALVFAVDIEHVEQLRDEFLHRGIAAASVVGTMPEGERRRVLEDFRDGKVQVLVNCEVLTEGYDERQIGCVVMARPTASLTLYTQCVGRGLRSDPGGGKADCLVLDVVDRGRPRRVVVASDLFGASVRDCEGRDIREAAAQEKARWRLEPLSPSVSLEADWELERETRWMELPTLHGYTPPHWLRPVPATEKQLRYLRSFRFDFRRELTKGEASYLIDRCKELKDEYPTPATPEQRAYLARVGKWRPGLTKHLAQRRIGRHQKGRRSVALSKGAGE